jgi:hypothetical protein
MSATKVSVHEVHYPSIDQLLDLEEAHVEMFGPLTRLWAFEQLHCRLAVRVHDGWAGRGHVEQVDRPSQVLRVQSSLELGVQLGLTAAVGDRRMGVRLGQDDGAPHRHHDSRRALARVLALGPT